ncbi:MAG: Hsp20/alpha crystallin family protein [Candidatus Pacebacteria bacterium]|nr:Hsp20/alpha crystallin family protein [Candidatus Paceibacterota bacterium]
MMKQKKSFLDKIVGGSEEDQLKESEGREEAKPIGIENVERDESVGMTEEGVQEEWMDEGVAEDDGQLAIDVYQTEDAIVVKSIIGGIRPEDLDLTVTNDMVTIKGVRQNSEEIVDDNYYYQECFWGSFSRSVILPCDIRTDGVEASMKNGILTIRMPKIEKGSSTKVEVREE